MLGRTILAIVICLAIFAIELVSLRPRNLACTTPFTQSCGAAARALDELAFQRAVTATLHEVVGGRGGQDSCREGEDEERSEADELHVSDVGASLAVLFILADGPGSDTR
ncbi:hypothetical protein B0H19DRAFT_1076621 [Mycena capillaripes]|nr:hypothetical protein B0H19DRAFT_1076621 [Mycena capillaripes]